ncbi:transcriptional repressor NrdR [Candidatus Microgenomates bacterium]|nr:transcriptional repressor NrdR [Candidatus Microgenomates bacterium]
MKCPYCHHSQSEVMETRDSEDLTAIRRRRECIKCQKRFTTYERVESAPLIVIKKDGRREQFSRDKLEMGVIKAAEKTMTAMEDVKKLVDEVERELRNLQGIEISSKNIGQLVMRKLKLINKIAYIRFASVYRKFDDLEDFEKEVKKLL